MYATLATLLEKPLVRREPLRELDAIVVLGAPLGPAGTLTDVLAERVDAAARLYHAGGAKTIVATGGATGVVRPEAEAMAEALVERGVPEADLIVEPVARNTFENAFYAVRAMSPLDSAWIVTQPFHLRRAVRLFRAEGVDAHPWHIDDSLEYRDRARAVRWLVREYGSWARELVVGLGGRRWR
jgi:uncharacterized SAM-binding protein YcdF (DUF218 family)